MKTIDTLIQDVEELLKNGLPGGYEDAGLGERLAAVLERGLEPRDGERATRLWFSNVGSPCVRQLWYKINTPDKARPFNGSTKFKFLYGDYIEEVFLELARLAGHVVEYQQERVEWNGVSGRIDAIIDGYPVDVKSTSSRSFVKFKSGLNAKNDSFGYLGQLKGYVLALREKGLIAPDWNKAAFVVINKETGRMFLDVHEFSDKDLSDFTENTDDVKLTVQHPHVPYRGFKPEPDGYKNKGRFIPNGNGVLGVNCVYCPFRDECWPGLRVFMYSYGPKYYTHIVKEPRVEEVTGADWLDD